MNNVNYPSGVRGPMDGEAGKSFTLPSRYYFDADIYQRELQQVFHRSWCYVGHVSQIPNPGDYYVDKIADQCVFIMRTDEATVKAFFNVCQHRGHQLLNGKGNTKKASGDKAVVVLDGGINPVSRVTVAALEDMGYRVNFDVAYQLRMGRGVNKDFVQGPPGFEENVYQHRILMSTVIYFGKKNRNRAESTGGFE